MELMLIVWLVSILSNIKVFVSTYTVMCVVVVAVVYILSKLRYKVAVHRVFDGISRDYNSILDYSEVQVARATSKVPVGKYKISKYRNHCKLFVDMNWVSLSIPELMSCTTLKQDKDEMLSSDPDPIPYLSQVKTAGYVAIGMIVASVLLPSDTTMKYMAGAYLVQSVYESDLVQSAAPIARDAVNNQLKLWAKDTPDMDVLVRQAEQAAAAVKVVENVGPTSDPSK